MGAQVHPTAVVGNQTKIGKDVVIGPFCVIDDGAEIGDGCVLESYVRVHHSTRLGRKNRVQAFTSLGGDPEDLKFNGERSYLEIGDENDIREHVTINRGTAGGGSMTRVGSHCLLQNKVHLGHDCVIGDGVIISAFSGLAGHVELEDKCIVGGGSLIHQFCRIGTGAMLGFGSVVSRSVAPYSILDGHSGMVEGANVVGLRRRGVANGTITAVSNALAYLYGDYGTLQERAAALLNSGTQPPDQIAEIANFVLHRLGKRGLVHGKISTD